uniref:Uncharacterized protein n=1 Tax=Fagus sylvatica TaxID=28930 RepID=A0A2N9G7Y7_FAGSY
MPRCERRPSRRRSSTVTIVRCGGSDVDRAECSAFSSLQPGMSLQAKPSRASYGPVPVQQGLAQPSIVQCLRQVRNSLTLDLASFFFFFFASTGLATVHQQ